MRKGHRREEQKRRNGAALGEAVENYLKAIYELGEGDDSRVGTKALAEHLGISAPSVTGMIKKLADLEPALLDHKPRQGVRLTELGEKIAVEVIRHHRLIERFLHDALGYRLDEVHDEAERLEHVISEDFEDRVDAALGHPEYDPHGSPIPRKDGSIPEQRGRPLSRVRPPAQGLIVRVPDRDAKRLKFLADAGIRPGQRVRVEAGRNDGDRTLTLLGQEIEGSEAAQSETSERGQAELLSVPIRVPAAWADAIWIELNQV